MLHHVIVGEGYPRPDPAWLSTGPSAHDGIA